MLPLVNEAVEPYVAKAGECLAGARSELANGRYNNAANRAYYAAYNAAIVALLRAGVNSRSWGHGEVQASFARELIHRRKVFPTSHRKLLPELDTMRSRGDYGRRTTSQRDAIKVVREAEQFLRIVLEIQS